MTTNKIFLLVLLSALCISCINSTFFSCPKPRVIIGKCNSHGVKPVTIVTFLSFAGHCIKFKIPKVIHCPRRKPHLCKCNAIGDPHYRLYDGQYISFYGDCKYTLSKYSNPKSECAFDVSVQNEYRGSNTKFSYTKTVFIKMYNTEFVLGKGKVLKVNGVAQDIPYESKGVRVFHSGLFIQFVAKRCLVKVAFDGNTNAFVQIPRNYSSNLSGICGNCNGKRDDLKTKSGTDVSNDSDGDAKIGNSYYIRKQNETCKSAQTVKLDNVCRPEWLTKVKSERFCGSILKANGPFATCAKSGLDLKQYFKNCIIDLCGVIGNEAEMDKSRCEIYAGMDELCTQKGFHGIKWREVLKCPKSCRKNQHFTTKAPPCPKTCENHFFGTKAPCYDLPEREDCVCDEGYILDGSLCVRPINCKCIESCFDRKGEKVCAEWKAKGRCKTFRQEMNSLCTKTCGFCNPKTSECKNQLSTRKCLQFLTDGKCSHPFYKSICGLTCNLQACKCGEDTKVVGECDEDTKYRIITYTKFVRNYRGSCIKKIRQVKEVCGCEYTTRTETGPCNFCLGEKNITTFIQEEANGTCQYRKSVVQEKCSTCPANPKQNVECVSDNMKVIKTTSDQKDGCFKCVPRTKHETVKIVCKNQESQSKCDNKTCMQSFTLKVRTPVNCKCEEEETVTEKQCCCNKPEKKLSPMCSCGQILERTIFYKFENEECKPYFKDRYKIPHCVAPKSVKGVCEREKDGKFYCQAKNVYYSAEIDDDCQCKIKKEFLYQTCCCPKSFNTTSCDDQMGVKYYTQNTFSLKLVSNKLICIKDCETKSVQIDNTESFYRIEGKCNQNGFRKIKIMRRFRDGCERKDEFYKLAVELCACIPKMLTKVMCSRNNVITRLTYKRILTSTKECTEELISKQATTLTCPPQKTIRGDCILPNYMREVKYYTYTAVNCKCEEQMNVVLEKCVCKYKEINKTIGECEKDTCTRINVLLFQNSECQEVTQEKKEKCCCTSKPRKEVKCNQEDGHKYQTTFTEVFDESTKSCIEKTSTDPIKTVCAKDSVSQGKCGVDKPYYQKIVTVSNSINKEKCACDKDTQVNYKICSCPKNTTKISCQDEELVNEVTTYSINEEENKCIDNTVRTTKKVTCDSVPKDKIINLDACRYKRITYSYEITNCNCKLKQNAELFFKCCNEKPKSATVCKDGNTLLTVSTKYVVANDGKSCVPKNTDTEKIIKCKEDKTTHETDCIKGNKTITIKHFSVKECKCGLEKTDTSVKLCKCLPEEPSINRKCLGKKWEITTTVLNLVDNKCVPQSTKESEEIECPDSQVKTDKCVGQQGSSLTVTTFYDIEDCKCVKKNNTNRNGCLCSKEVKIDRGKCDENNKRAVKKLNKFWKGSVCEWVVVQNLVEDCKCDEPTEKITCLQEYRKVSHYSKSELRQVVESGVTISKCIKTSSTKLQIIKCTYKYQYTTDCVNYQKSTILTVEKPENCKCVKRQEVVKKEACDCHLKNKCFIKCINNVKRRICFKFKQQGQECVKEKSVKGIKVHLCKPKVNCGICNIQKNYGNYKSCEKTYCVIQKCTSIVKKRKFSRLCSCKGPESVGPKCKNNELLLYRIRHVRVGQTCLRKVKKQKVPIVCFKPSLEKDIEKCKVSYKLTQFKIENCKCVKVEKTDSNSKCCHSKPEQKVCMGSKWKFIKVDYIQTKTDKPMFPTYKASPVKTKCVQNVKTSTTHIECPAKIVEKKCNPQTGTLTISNYYYIIENCKCKRQVKNSEEDCVKCPARRTKKSACKLAGDGKKYQDITITYYSLQINNTCKKLVKHEKEICACQKPTKTKTCKNGYEITSVTKYRIDSVPPCSPDVSQREKLISCYNDGQVNPWKIVRVKKCLDEHEFSITYYEREVFDNCKCVLKKKSEKTGICCQLCKVNNLCVNDDKMVTINTCWDSTNLVCEKKVTNSTQEITCAKPEKKLIGKCNEKNGVQKFQLIKEKSVNCKCKKSEETLSERCKCFPTVKKVCDKNGQRLLVTETNYKLEDGKCIPNVATKYDNIMCTQDVKFDDKPINDCQFRRTTLTRKVRNCICVFVKTSEKILNNKCCMDTVVTKTCENDRLQVFNSTVYELKEFICFPKSVVEKKSVECNDLELKTTASVGQCVVEDLFYEIVYKNCTCNRKLVRKNTREICCDHKQNTTKSRCDSVNGFYITENTVYRLEGDACVPDTKENSVSIKCDRKKCTEKKTPCIGNTMKTTLLCKKRKDCQCVDVVSKVYSSCCNAQNRTVQSDCINNFETFKLYSFLMNNDTGKCEEKLVQQFNRRCGCPTGNVTESCVDHVTKRKTIISFTLNSEFSCTRNIKNEDDPVFGCTKKREKIRLISDICDDKTLNGTKTYEYKMAKDCECEQFTDVEHYYPCKCPDPVENKFCENDNTIVTILKRATCSPNVVSWKEKRTVQKIKECPAPHTNETNCVPTTNNNAISEKTVFSIKVQEKDCKCVPTIVDKKTVPCECEEGDTNTECVNNTLVTQTTYYQLENEKCVKKSKVNRKETDCPNAPLVVKSKCKDNEYTITTTKYFKENCKCNTDVNTDECDCKCPKKSSRVVCSKNYYFNKHLTNYKMKDCKCQELTSMEQVDPECPIYEPKTISDCVKGDKEGYRTIIERELVKDKEKCKCTVKENKRKEVCWCKNVKTSDKSCVNGKILVIKLFQVLLQEETKSCERKLIETKDNEVKCPETVVDHKCNSTTGIEIETTKSYVIENCKCVPKVNRKRFRCGCSETWQLANKGKCSMAPSCVRVDKYVRKELKNRECVTVSKSVTVKCCCYPAVKVKHVCVKSNHNITSTTKYKLVGAECVGNTVVKTNKVICSKRIELRKSDCVNGKSSHRYYGSVAKDCKCVDELIKEINCDCKCPASTETFKCRVNDGVKVITNKTYAIENCKCRMKVQTNTEDVGCPKQNIDMSDCVGKPGEISHTQQKVTTTYALQEDCSCSKTVKRKEVVCGCEKQPTKSNNCNSDTGIVTAKSCQYVFTKNKCINKCVTQQIPTICGSKKWRVVDAGTCVPSTKHGQRIMTLSRTIRDGCKCKEQMRTKSCECECSKPTSNKECVNNRIKITEYNYELEKCKCKQQRKVMYDSVKCAAKNPVVGKCTVDSDGISRKCTETFISEVRDCKCFYKPIKECKVCGCPACFDSESCDESNNKIIKTKTCFKLADNECKKDTDSSEKEVSCNLKTSCKQISACNTKTNMQIYACTRGVVEKCVCRNETENKQFQCSCKKSETRVADCDKTTCIRQIHIINYINKVLINGETSCEPDVKQRVEKCCCLQKPKEKMLCENNRKIKRISTWRFNETEKGCEKDVKNEDITPECDRTPKESMGKCDPQSCLRDVNITTKYLEKCVCESSMRTEKRPCCCLKKNREEKSCDAETQQIRVKSFRYKFENGKCNENIDINYVPVNCPEEKVELGKCNDTTRKQTKVTTRYEVVNCNCKPKVKTDVFVCKCLPPEESRNCKEQLGVIVTSVKTYELNSIKHVCIEKFTQSNEQVQCNENPTYTDIGKGECQIQFKDGYYRKRRKVYEMRVGCVCEEYKEIEYVLCSCAKDYVKRHCENNMNIKTLYYFVKTKSSDKNYDYACQKKSRVESKEKKVCKFSRLDIGDCIDGFKEYRKNYEVPENCKCVARSEKVNVKCKCPKPSERKECIGKGRYKKLVTSYRLICTRSLIPKCKCVKNTKESIENVICESESVNVDKCIKGKESVYLIHYEIDKCDCVEKKYVKVRDCGGCVDVPHDDTCALVKASKSCQKSAFKYKYLCPLTCGYCKPCPKSVSKIILEKCKCRMTAGVKICSEKVQVTEYIQSGRECINKTKMYETLCQCINDYSNEKCDKLAKAGNCSNSEVRQKCAYACNPGCNVCLGKETFRECVQSGVNKGKYEVLRAMFVKVDNVCVLKSKTTYEGVCAVCSKNIRKEVSQCINGQRKVISNFVLKVNNTCVNKQKVDTFSCDGCCSSVYTDIGDCVPGKFDKRYRTVTKVFWAKINKCCRKKTVINILECGEKCQSITKTSSKCLNNKRLEMRAFRWGAACEGKMTVHEIKDCVANIGTD